MDLNSLTRHCPSSIKAWLCWLCKHMHFLSLAPYSPPRSGVMVSRFISAQSREQDDTNVAATYSLADSLTFAPNWWVSWLNDKNVPRLKRSFFFFFNDRCVQWQTGIELTQKVYTASKIFMIPFFFFYKASVPSPPLDARNFWKKWNLVFFLVS